MSEDKGPVNWNREFGGCLTYTLGAVAVTLFAAMVGTFMAIGGDHDMIGQTYPFATTPALVVFGVGLATMIYSYRQRAFQRPQILTATATLVPARVSDARVSAGMGNVAMGCMSTVAVGMAALFVVLTFQTSGAAWIMLPFTAALIWIAVMAVRQMAPASQTPGSWLLGAEGHPTFPLLPHRHTTGRGVRLSAAHHPGQQAIIATIIGLGCGGLAVISALAPGGQATAVVLAAVALVGIAFAAYTGLHIVTVGEPVVEVSVEPLVPGQTAHVYVTQSGHHNLRRLEVTILCREWVQYFEGTDTYTDSTFVYRKTLVDRSNVITRSGQPSVEQDFTIPENAMHSFSASNNRIEWLVEIYLESADAILTTAREEYLFRVAPRREAA